MDSRAWEMHSLVIHSYSNGTIGYDACVNLNDPDWRGKLEQAERVAQQLAGQRLAEPTNISKLIDKKRGKQ